MSNRTLSLIPPPRQDDIASVMMGAIERGDSGIMLLRALDACLPDLRLRDVIAALNQLDRRGLL
jgi:hypothetical protein